MCLDSINYLVEEGQEVRVCAQLMSSRSSCIVSFPFSVVVHTQNETGMIFEYTYCQVLFVADLRNQDYTVNTAFCQCHYSHRESLRHYTIQPVATAVCD